MPSRNSEPTQKYAYFCWTGDEPTQKVIAIGPETAARQYAVKRLDLNRLTGLGSDALTLVVHVANVDGTSLAHFHVETTLRSQTATEDPKGGFS